MYITPVGSGSCQSCESILQSRSADSVNIFKIINPPAQDVSSVKPWWAPETDSIFDTMLSVSTALYAQNTAKEEQILAPGIIQMYLQFPNESIQKLANQITKGISNNDDKATAITRWVIRNLPYQTDQENYGVEELWVGPTFLLQKGSGDCEDLNFAIHSLLLHAGIPYDRIRTYGGMVKAGEGAELGGHAWTAYRRETDDEWVILDAAYYPTLQDVKERPLMKNNPLFVENFFYFNKLYWTNLTNIDKIHNPGAAYTYNAKGILKRQLQFAGMLMDAFS